MHVSRPALNLHLAETMLRQYFQSSKKADLAQLHEFVDTCVEDDLARRKMKMRLLKQETNQVLVAMVVHSLTQEWQRFLVLRYKWQSNNTEQVRILHVSNSQLSNWNYEIRMQVYHALQYHLLPQDIFRMTKIVNMLETLGRFVVAKEELDPNYEILDVNWFRSVVQYYNQYSELLDCLNVCCQKKTLEDCIISYVVQNPHQTIKQIAQSTHQPEGKVTSVIRNFRKSVSHLVFHD